MDYKKAKFVWDPNERWPVLKELEAGEKRTFDFGEAVGLIAFGFWWPGIRKGHQWHMTTYDFPVRLKFIYDRKAPKGRENEWNDWNLPEWIKCAKELEEEGVRAIVCGCGLAGTMQKELSDAVEVPVFTSTLLFVPLISRTLKKNQKVGILTVSSEALTRWDHKLLRECGVDKTIPIVIAGMTESEYCDVWWSQLDLDFDPEKVQSSIANVAKKMISDNPEIGALVCECTDMTPFLHAIRHATDLPVFDAVDMVRYVYNIVKY
jgi:Asp/Glu/hydantoin racemase